MFFFVFLVAFVFDLFSCYLLSQFLFCYFITLVSNRFFKIFLFGIVFVSLALFEKKPKIQKHLKKPKKLKIQKIRKLKTQKKSEKPKIQKN